MAETQTQKQPKLNQYEAMFLVGPSGAAEPQAAIDLCRGIIERHGGQIMVIKRWDERKLAYEINKQKRGTYVIAYFRAPGNAVTPIEREVNLSEDVLRVMVTDADHLSENEMAAVEPQPIQPREERNPWDRPDFNRPPRRGGGGGGDRDRDDRGGDRGGDGDRGPRGPRREESAPTAGGGGGDRE